MVFAHFTARFSSLPDRQNNYRCLQFKLVGGLNRLFHYHFLCLSFIVSDTFVLVTPDLRKTKSIQTRCEFLAHTTRVLYFCTRDTTQNLKSLTFLLFILQISRLESQNTLREKYFPIHVESLKVSPYGKSLIL